MAAASFVYASLPSAFEIEEEIIAMATRWIAFMDDRRLSTVARHDLQLLEVVGFDQAYAGGIVLSSDDGGIVAGRHRSDYS